VAMRPRTGAKICLIIAAVLVVAGVYALVVPINMPTAQGVFGCGSGLYPPSDPFAVGVCQDLSVIQQLRAGALGLGALLVGGLGLLLFGVDRAPRPARRRDDLDPALDEA
jgi:hypothetical protein